MGRMTGVGLPAFEGWVLRHLGFPVVAKALGHEAARRLFMREGQRILYLAQDLREFELTERVLVRRPIGVEEGACYWSMEMLMEHLILVGVHVRDAVRQLASGVRPLQKFRLEEFYPEGKGRLRIRDEYGRFVERFAKVYETHRDLPVRPTHRHPCFGELNASQWLKFAAVHYKLHRFHAERIMEGL